VRSAIKRRSKCAITGVHRTWLDVARRDKARIADPRRSMGSVLGNGVRFGSALDVVLAGEGIETVLSLKCILPDLPMIAGLSANYLAALDLPSTLHRFYIGLDDDPAGRNAARHLRQRAEAHRIEVVDIVPRRSDFNHDLSSFGLSALFDSVVRQLVPNNRLRFAPDRRKQAGGRLSSDRLSSPGREASGQGHA
jgi:hypothetical protein